MLLVIFWGQSVAICNILEMFVAFLGKLTFEIHLYRLMLLKVGCVKIVVCQLACRMSLECNQELFLVHHNSHLNSSLRMPLHACILY